jgi:cyclopropane fatty-acyl-phospholipid synthase-like methyltransferase
MMKNPEELYTKKAPFYHRLFINILKYGEGLRSFFRNNHYQKKGMKILDAGCGTGIVSRMLYEIAQEDNLQGIKYHGFDITKAMLFLFKKWIALEKVKNISLEKADVLQLNKQLPSSWNNYDLIVSSAMLEYLPKNKIAKAIQGLSTRLKEDGTILIFITKKNFLMNLLIKIWWKANMYEEQEIKDILSNSGLKNVTFKKFPISHWYLNTWGFVIEAKKQ